MRRILDDPIRVIDIMRDVAETEIMSRFQDLSEGDISEKAPGDLVTVADQESERRFTEQLPKLVPDSQVLGEEGFEADPDTLNVLDGDAPVWIVDPVDGTFNFAHGKSPFTVIVALVQHHEIKAGWILDPVTNEAVWAIEGEGAFRMDSPNATAEPISRITRKFADTKLTAGAKLRRRLQRAASDLNTELPEIVDRYRCVGREYMDIALGAIDHARYGSKLKPWDHAAGCLIVRECGGRADHIDTAVPYTPQARIEWRNIGIVGDADHWADWQKLVSRADSYD